MINKTDRKILLVDDDISILNMLEVVFKKEQFTKIYKAENGIKAVDICKEINPDIIVLDIMLPDIDGYEVCRRIRTFSMCPILFLSARSEETDKLISFGVGGDSYITKPFNTKEVVALVSSMIRRISYYEQANITQVNEILFGDYIINFDKKQLFKNGKNINLTSKEYYLLEYLIQNNGTTISREKLLDKVWDIAFDGYDNTVMVHIRRLREKIEENPSSPVYLKTVKGRGYTFEIPQHNV